MKRNCKTCTLNTTNDTVETCKRMCYLRYSKQRNKRICDLEQEIQNLKQTLTEIKEIAEPFCNACQEFEPEKRGRNCMYCNYGKILQKISEVENEKI